MPKRCARCGDITRVRELMVPGDWLPYLREERGASEPVGTLKMPLCPDCYRDADDLLGGEAPAGEREEFLDGIDAGALVDEGV